MTTELTEDQIKNGKISIRVDIQLLSLEKHFAYQPGNKKRRNNIIRESRDKLTSLSQEQTVLLMYYLQKERVLLKDEYLTDSEAGQAFEILTGYSQDTLRQNLGKFYLIQNHTNLRALNDLLSRLKASLERDLAPTQQ